MTTAARDTPLRTGSRVLVRTSAVAFAAGALAVLVVAALAGGPAALGVAVGALIVLAVLCPSSLVVNAVAAAMPAASLLVALLTYTLQVLAMALVFAALSRSGLLDDGIDRQWLGGAAIAGTMVWMAAQIVITTRQRIPVYDLAQGAK